MEGPQVDFQKNRNSLQHWHVTPPHCVLSFSASELWSQWSRQRKSWRGLRPPSGRLPRLCCCRLQPHASCHIACRQNCLETSSGLLPRGAAMALVHSLNQWMDLFVMQELTVEEGRRQRVTVQCAIWSVWMLYSLSCIFV